MSLGYLYQDAEVVEGAAAAADGSTNLTSTPGTAFTSRTTSERPRGFTIGGGVRHTGGLHRGTDGAVGTPAYTEAWTVVDAMVSYALNEHVTLRLNGYNLADKRYVAAINKSGYRYHPGEPRTFMLTANVHF